MKIFALLVGINKYPIKPLGQCVSDTEKIKSYLNNLKNDSIDVKVYSLHDELATKEAIVIGIKDLNLRIKYFQEKVVQIANESK